MTEKEYRDLPNEKYLHYSLLSLVAREGGKCLFEKKDKSGNSLRFGSLVHTLCLSKELFDERYRVITNYTTLTGTQERFYKLIEEGIGLSNITLNDIKENNDTYIEFSLNIIKDNELWKNIKDQDKLLKYIIDTEFRNYCTETLSDLGDDRIVIGPEDFMLASLITKTLQENEHTKKYFTASEDRSKIQVLFEKAILFKIGKQDMKILLDIVFIDHQKKTVTMVDLKTGTDTHTLFTKSFYKWRYDIQAGLGQAALFTFVKKELSEYRVENPIFIYVNKADNNYQQPYIFKVKNRMLKGAFRGFISMFGNEVKGILELIEDIKYYRKTKQYWLSKELKDNGLIIDLNDDYVRRYSEQGNISRILPSQPPSFESTPSRIIYRSNNRGGRITSNTIPDFSSDIHLTEELVEEIRRNPISHEDIINSLSSTNTDNTESDG